MRRTKHRSRSKTEVKFQYGGSPFSETGSSIISAVNWDISSKFGMQTDFHLLTRMQSVALNTVVAFGLYARHLEKSIYVMTPPAIVWLRKNLAYWCKITCRWLHRSKLKQEIEFQYGDRPFSHTGSSIISTVEWDISSKFGMHIDFHHFQRMQSLNLNSEVDFRLYDRHLEKLIWRQTSADVCPITTKCRRRMQHDMLIITHTL